SMATDRSWCTATLLADGRVLVAGGLGNGAPMSVATAELYDPEADTWSPAASMSIVRAFHTATMLADGRVLVVGGATSYTHAGARASAEIYDPVRAAWSSTGSMSDTRALHTAAMLVDGRVLVAGGEAHDGPEVFRASAEIYTPGTGTWTAAGSMHAARS